MLAHAILKEVGHSIYAGEYMSVCEERGLPIPHSEADVPRLADETVHIQIVSRLIGRCEEGWHRTGFIACLKTNAGLAGATSDEAIESFAFHLLMGCAGHGIGLWDDDESLAKLEDHYRKPFNATPAYFELTEYRELAEVNVPGDPAEDE